MDFCTTHPNNPVDVFMGCAACQFEARASELALASKHKADAINADKSILTELSDAIQKMAEKLEKDAACPSPLLYELDEAKLHILTARRHLSTWWALCQQSVKR